MLLATFLNPILPIFMAMVAGYFMRKLKYFDVANAQGINRFVFYMAVPALLFNLIAKVPFAEISWPTVSAYLGSELLVYISVAFVMYRIFKLSLGESILLGMASGFVNHLLFVLPIAKTLYGVESVTPIVSIVFVDTIIFCCTVLTIEYIQIRQQKPLKPQSLFAVMLMILKNPLVIASSLGLIAASMPSIIPAGIFTYAGFVGAAAAPASLFALGVILAGQSLQPISWIVGLTVFAKLILHPLLFTAFATYSAISPDWQKMVLLVAAGPCGAMPFVIAMQYGIESSKIAKAVMISTVLSLLSLSYLTAA
jgi:malonate transporter and related proteins